MKIKLIILILFSYSLQAQITNEYESQANVIFKNEYIKKQNKKITLKVNFNNAVLYLEQEKYIKAINLFKQTAHKLKVPSYLNIGIAYYKLNSLNNAYLYLKKLYDFKQLSKFDLYSYVSASYYLYLITNDRKYLTSILNAEKNTKNSNINSSVNSLLVDTYITLKIYDKAIIISKKLKNINNLKLALLYIKIKKYDLAQIYLSKALEQTKNEDDINRILWFKVFTDLKTNNVAIIKENLDSINQRLDEFRKTPRLPLKIYFNKDKYNANEYFSKILNFDTKREIDLLFYFVPFIFSDNKQIEEQSIFAFVLKDNKSVKSLDMMLEYNKNFVDLVKEDPIIRANKLQDLLNVNKNVKAYEYYNLAVSYAHIYNYKNAYKYFLKAHMLDKANKLYSSLSLVSALISQSKINKKLKSNIENNLLSKDGTYKYLGKYIYKIILNKRYKLDVNTASVSDKKTILYRFLEFMNNKVENKIDIQEPLLQENIKDPLIFLFYYLAKLDSESQYDYVSRLQDYLINNFNDYFLKGPNVVIQYYIDTLKALGIFNKVNFDLPGDISPTYLRTKALVNLYLDKGNSSVEIIENLQTKYNLEDKYTYDLLIASYLSIDDYSNASATLAMLQFELNDNDAKFLNAVQLVNNLKIKSAKSSFTKKYEGKLIDFKLIGLDKYLEDL